MPVLTQSDRLRLSQLSRAGLPALSAVAASVAGMRLLWARRRTRTHLRHLPPHLLRDVGISPDDARLEAGKPFWRP